MQSYLPGAAVSAISISLLTALPAAATPFFFSTGDPDGKIATATRPSSAGKIEIESADDFVVTGSAHITSATFTGLLTGGASVGDVGNVRVEIYGVFPNNSDVGRTSGPPVFSTPQVPTRVNSPSDVAIDERDVASGNLTFSTVALGDFTANNSVQPGGINPKPNQTTTGDGAVTGTEVRFTANFTSFDLPTGHYFFIPQVEVTAPDGEFLWLSAPKPIVAPGTPFNPDLQSWTRDENLAPDWLRIGTDIVGAGAFNATFSLNGTIPEPASIGLVGAALSVMAIAGLRRRRS